MHTPARLLIVAATVLALAGTAAAQTFQGAINPVDYLPLVTAGSAPAAQPTLPTVAPTGVPDLSGCTLDGEGLPLDSRCFSIEVVRLVNVERAKAGCPAAVIDERLMLGAQNWSLEMERTGYGHSPLGWYARSENGGFSSTAVGENIGPSGDPQSIVDAWMASQGHRNLILSCAHSNPDDPSTYDPQAVYEIGVGNTKGVWWVLVLDVL